MLTTILRGKEYKSQWAKEITRLLPIFSFTTKIMDDIADLNEDIQCKRPSYAVGAIRENPDEFKCMKEFLDNNPSVAKITPEMFKKLCPNSFSKVIS